MAPRMCPGCDKVISCLSKLTVHVRIHIGDKPFHCQLCDYKSAFPGALTRHRLLDSNEKPFPCSYSSCDRRFKRKDDLAKHERVHSGERPFECPMCKLRFARKDTRHVHMWVMHLGEVGAPLGPTTTSSRIRLATAPWTYSVAVGKPAGPTSHPTSGSSANSSTENDQTQQKVASRKRMLSATLTSPAAGEGDFKRPRSAVSNSTQSSANTQNSTSTADDASTEPPAENAGILADFAIIASEFF